MRKRRAKKSAPATQRDRFERPVPLAWQQGLRHQFSNAFAHQFGRAQTVARVLLQAPHFGVKLWRLQNRHQTFEVHVFPVDHIMPKAGEHGNENAPITTAENKTTDIAHAPFQWERIEILLLVGSDVAENLHVDLAPALRLGLDSQPCQHEFPHQVHSHITFSAACLEETVAVSAYV